MDTLPRQSKVGATTLLLAGLLFLVAGLGLVPAQAGGPVFEPPDDSTPTAVESSAPVASESETSEADDEPVLETKAPTATEDPVEPTTSPSASTEKAPSAQPQETASSPTPTAPDSTADQATSPRPSPLPADPAKDDLTASAAGNNSWVWGLVAAAALVVLGIGVVTVGLVRRRSRAGQISGQPEPRSRAAARVEPPQDPWAALSPEDRAAFEEAAKELGLE